MHWSLFDRLYENDELSFGLSLSENFIYIAKSSRQTFYSYEDNERRGRHSKKQMMCLSFNLLNM